MKKTRIETGDFAMFKPNPIAMAIKFKVSSIEERNGKLMACGEYGCFPKICLWKITEKQFEDPMFQG